MFWLFLSLAFVAGAIVGGVICFVLFIAWLFAAQLRSG